VLSWTFWGRVEPIGALAVCALTMLAAPADAACWARHGELGGVGMVAALLVHGDGDVVAAGRFGYAG
jgi:hypothetical protein